MKVYRYAIPTESLGAYGEFTVNLPIDAAVIHFGYQEARQDFSLWATTEGDHIPLENRSFALVGTGHDFDGGGRPVGSAIMPNGFHVFHLFEMKE